MQNIVLFGAPGAGKGTQAERLVSFFSYAHVSTGDLLRSEIAKGSELGKQIDQTIGRGEFVSDEMVAAMVEQFVESHLDAQGIIFDGYPRTVKQAQTLKAMMEKYGLEITCMLALEVDEEELVKRICDRAKTSGRADDAEEAVIRRRIEVYHEKTAPVAAYYQAKNKYCGVNGMGSVDAIFERIKQELIKRIK